MKGKVLSIIFAVAILVSSLSGCGNPSGKNQSSQETANTTKQETSNSSQETSKANTDEFVTIKTYFVGGKGTVSDEVFGKINEKLKVDINAQMEGYFIDWSDWDTKYPLVLASGEDFDAIYTSNWCFYAQEATKGAYYQLTEDMLKSYAPLSYEKITPEQWDQTKIGGKIFMIPMSRREYSKPVFIVRGDLMKKYGISEIKTREDMIKFWDAIASNEKGIYPLALGLEGGSDEYSYLEQVFTTSPYAPFNNKDYYATPYLQTLDVTDPQNIKVIDNEPYRLEFFKLLKGFRQKGYWTKNALTQQSEANNMFSDGKSATAVRQVDNLNGTYISTMRDHPEWEPILVDIATDKPAHANPATNNGMAVHATSKNPERTLRMLDLFEFEKSYTDLVFYGIEGTHWEAIGDDSFRSLGDFTINASMGFGGSLMRKPEGSAPNYRDIYKVFDSNQYTSILDFFNFDDSSVKTEIAAVSSVIKKYRPILNLGCDDNVEKGVQARDSELKKAGIEKIQEEFFRQASEFCKNYGK